MLVKDYIRRKGFKQGEIGRTLGIEPGAFSKIVNGFVVLPQKYVEPLCKILNLSSSQIQRKPTLRITFVDPSLEKPDAIE